MNVNMNKVRSSAVNLDANSLNRITKIRPGVVRGGKKIDAKVPRR